MAQRVTPIAPRRDVIDCDLIHARDDETRLNPLFLRTSRLVPLGTSDGRLMVGAADPVDPHALAALTFAAGRAVETVPMTSLQVAQLLDERERDAGPPALMPRYAGTVAARLRAWLAGEAGVGAHPATARWMAQADRACHDDDDRREARAALLGSIDRLGELHHTARLLAIETLGIGALAAACAARVAPLHTFAVVAATFALLAANARARGRNRDSPLTRAEALDTVAILERLRIARALAVPIALARVADRFGGIAPRASATADLALLLRLEPEDAASLAVGRPAANTAILALRFEREARRALTRWRWLVKALGLTAIVLFALNFPVRS